MVRPEFKDVAQAEAFINKRIKPSNKEYYGFITEAGEVCLLPGKSTSPVVYVRIKKATLSEARKLGFDIYPVDTFEWNAENTPRRE